MAAKKTLPVQAGKTTNKIDVSLETLLEAGAHFGHHYRRWNPKMREYLYAVKDGVYVFDLIKTKAALEEALEAIEKTASEGKVILFIGTKKQAKEKVKEVAEACESPYVIERWLGGTLTNFDQIKRTVAQIDDLTEIIKTAKEQGFTKKERLMMTRKLEKLKRMFGGIKTMSKHPDLMIIIDTHGERGAVAEADVAGITTVGVVDSNANPKEVDYPVPMNDDASKSLDYVLDLFKEAVLSGKKLQAKKLKS